MKHSADLPGVKITEASQILHCFFSCVMVKMEIWPNVLVFVLIRIYFMQG